MISDENDCNGYATIDSHIYTRLALDSQSSVKYDYVMQKPNTFPKLKNANAVLKGKNIKIISQDKITVVIYIATKSQGDDCDEGYVIDNINSDHSYLHSE